MKVQGKYYIVDVSDALSSGAVEYLGSKRKGWFTLRVLKDVELRFLFKLGRLGTGENWAEKVTSELAELLNLHHATYDLASLGKYGLCVISPSFIEEGEELRLGNELIEGFDKDQIFNNTKHTLDAILNALLQNNVQLPWNTLEQEPVITNARDLFIGYMCFDSWIANTDRHAENWGIITKANNINVLAPTFDHASSLGRNESDERRIERLHTKDKGFNVQAYVRRAVMPIYDDKGCALDTTSLVRECKRYAPKATSYWIEKIGKLMENDKKIREIFDRIPDEFISRPAKDFAMAILSENARMLREYQND